MSLLHQWKANTLLQFWEIYQTATPTNIKDLWYILTEKWNRTILPPSSTTTVSSSTSSYSSWEVFSTKIQVIILKLLDRTLDYSYENPDVVLFIVTFLYVRWDLKPYLNHDDDSVPKTSNERRRITGAFGRGHPPGNEEETTNGLATTTTTWNDDDHYIEEDGIVKVKRKVYKDKGLYNFMAQCQDMKKKLRRVEPTIDSSKKKKTEALKYNNKSDNQQQKSSFLNLSPERLRNLRGNLKSTPPGQTTCMK